MCARALPLAVHLHGAAADQAVRSGLGPVGLTASEVTETARTVLNQWVYGRLPAPETQPSLSLFCSGLAHILHSTYLQ